VNRGVQIQGSKTADHGTPQAAVIGYQLSDYDYDYEQEQELELIGFYSAKSAVNFSGFSG